MIKPKVDKFRGHRPKSIRKAFAEIENIRNTDDEMGDGIVDTISSFLKKAADLTIPTLGKVSKAVSTITPGIQSGINTYNSAMAAKKVQ